MSPILKPAGACKWWTYCFELRRHGAFCPRHCKEYQRFRYQVRKGLTPDVPWVPEEIRTLRESSVVG